MQFKYRTIDRFYTCNPPTKKSKEYDIVLTNGNTEVNLSHMKVNDITTVACVIPHYMGESKVFVNKYQRII